MTGMRREQIMSAREGFPLLADFVAKVGFGLGEDGVSGFVDYVSLSF